MYSYIYIISYVDLYVLSMSVSMLCTHVLLYNINVFDCICDIIYAFIITTHILPVCMTLWIVILMADLNNHKQSHTHIYIYIIVVSWMNLNS